MFEAVCQSCGETFTPTDWSDLEHVERLDGTPCGGMGVMVREWGFNVVDDPEFR